MLVTGGRLDTACFEVESQRSQKEAGELYSTDDFFESIGNSSCISTARGDITTSSGNGGEEERFETVWKETGTGKLQGVCRTEAIRLEQERG